LRKAVLIKGRRLIKECKMIEENMVN